MTSVAESAAPHLGSTATPQQATAQHRRPPGSAAASTARQMSAHSFDKFFTKFCATGDNGPSVRSGGVDSCGEGSLESAAVTVSDAEAARLFEAVLSAFDNTNPASGRKMAQDSCCGSPDVAAAVLAKYLVSSSINL